MFITQMPMFKCQIFSMNLIKIHVAIKCNLYWNKTNAYRKLCCEICFRKRCSVKISFQSFWDNSWKKNNQRWRERRKNDGINIKINRWPNVIRMKKEKKRKIKKLEVKGTTVLYSICVSFFFVQKRKHFDFYAHFFFNVHVHCIKDSRLDKEIFTLWKKERSNFETFAHLCFECNYMQLQTEYRLYKLHLKHG